MDHVFIEEIWTRRFIENAGPAALVIGKVVATAWIQVLHVDCVAAGTNVNGGLLGDGSQSGPWSDFVIGIVAKLRCCIIHLAADLFESVCARSRVLSRIFHTLSRCF